MSFFKNIVGSALEIAYFTILGIIIYLSVLWVFDSGRLYYDGIIAVVITVLISWVIIYFACTRLSFIKRRTHQRSLINAAVAATMIVYSFHITIPTIIDRSISLYILSRMDGRTSGIKFEELQQSFLEGYVNGHNAVCRRLDEQLVTGNIRFEEESYYITPNGARVMDLLRNIAKLVRRNEYYVTESQSTKLLYQYEIKDGQCKLESEQ